MLFWIIGPTSGVVFQGVSEAAKTSSGTESSYTAKSDLGITLMEEAQGY